MFNGIKRIKSMNKQIGDVHEEYDENGMLIVKLNLRDEDNFLSPFSYGSIPILDSNIEQYLNSCVRPAKCKQNIHLKIYSYTIDESEKKIYEQAIRNTFKQSYVSEKQHMQKSLIASLIMLFVSLSFLSLMFLFDYFKLNSIFIELIDIIAWVFMWEAVDIFFFKRHVINWSQQKNIGFYNAKISFLSAQTKEIK
ncbi:MAG: hypothetical protein RR140_01245 [Clostridia bacterium]